MRVDAGTGGSRACLHTLVLLARKRDCSLPPSDRDKRRSVTEHVTTDLEAADCLHLPSLSDNSIPATGQVLDVWRCEGGVKECRGVLKPSEPWLVRIPRAGLWGMVLLHSSCQ